MSVETSGRPVQPRLQYNDRLQQLDIDLEHLYRDLKGSIDGEVRLDQTARAMYSADASNYRQIPIGVVLPRHVDDVIAAVRIARSHGAPILGRGGGTSLAGQCCNTGIIIDFSKYMNRILELNPDERWARVEPGVVLDDLRNAAEEHHLTFGPDPATHSHCTLGGMIGNNSCGIHAIVAGRTSENVHELEVLTYDGVRLRVGPATEEELERRCRVRGREGEIFSRLRDLRDRYAEEIVERFPSIPRRGSGYPLEYLLAGRECNIARALVGTESTCVLILEAKVRLIHSPPKRAMVVLGYPDIFQAGDHVARVRELQPIGLEGIDEALTHDMRDQGLHVDNLDLLPEGKGWLLVEFGGETEEEAKESASRAVKELRSEKNAPQFRILTDRHDQETVWEVRESGLGATAHVPGRPETWPGWEDAAVPPDKIGAYLRDFRHLLDRFGYDCDLYGHFGDGCVHCRINFDFTNDEGVARYREFVTEAAHLVVRHGGSLSGEHGDGQARGELLKIMFGEDLIAAFREFKRIWDPDGKMNPGKLVDAYFIDENLRIDGVQDALERDAWFHYPKDDGRFGKALLRCVGVGKCRRAEGGVMCPSYMATREEQHTTRGRARALFEMIRGESILDGWNSDAVHDTLDLCLSCKGCKSDCPVEVDIATYKAEFLAHYYRRHLRPRTAWTMGLIHWWARAAAIAPGVANFFAPLTKFAAGVHPARELPRFASRRERARVRSAGDPAPRNRAPRPVVLWVDTFNEAFHPQTIVAAKELLARAGYSAQLSEPGLCCGRPLYEYGFLDLARKLLLRNLDALPPEVPVVGLEPSCVSVFRDELPNLLADDERAVPLSERVMTLSEFALREEIPLPRIDAAALLQIHCHQRSVLDGGAELELLRRMGIDVTVPEEGCCGMAGAFGLEKEKYEVSMRIGERSLLPAVRQAPERTLVIADGFSCREQIAQKSGRRALHLAEVINSYQRYADT
ncbi:MAG: FAD-binding oxidoreductase [Acidobacteria bacterium]|nr:FAD-binding oxidoreductase [Acidobacteriota bacterium]